MIIKKRKCVLISEISGRREINGYKINVNFPPKLVKLNQTLVGKSEKAENETETRVVLRINL